MGKEVMGKKENEMAQEKERPAGSQSLFRGLMLIEILSNYPNGCPLAHLSELAGLNISFPTAHRLPKSPRTTATNTAFHKFLLPLKWTSLSTVPPAMPSCNVSWITLLPLNALTKTRPSAYPATNLLPCWPKTAVTVLPLMTACGPKSRRYKEISHDFWTYRAAQSVPFARRH